jgi:signal transduction histidine kinase
VLDQSGNELSDFITVGLDARQISQIGRLPRGHGILGLLITQPHPVRLHDLREHPTAYGFPVHHPTMASFLGVPLRVGNRAFGNLYLTDKEGDGDFTDADEQSIVALAATAAIAIENARLFLDLQRREQWLAATSEIQRALLSHASPQVVLQLVAERARDIAEAALSFVVLEHDDGSLIVEAVAGNDDLTGRSLPREGALIDVVEHGATVHIAEGFRLAGFERLHGALLVPFTAPAGVGGALVVGSVTGTEYRRPDATEVDALHGFAAQASIALDRAQGREDRETLAVLADRDRIARDLHDLVIQRLFATGMTLRAATRMPASTAVSDRIRSAIGDLDATIKDIRETIFELSHVEDGSVRTQIHELVRVAQSTLGFRPALTIEGPVDAGVPDHVRPHLVAVLVEALSNVAQHAKASTVWVRVAVDGIANEASLQVEINDDGRGFIAGHTSSGLRNMRERAESIGGVCVVQSEPGKGTTIRWTVPLGKPAI